MDGNDTILIVLGTVQVVMAALLVIAFRQITLISLRVGLLQNPQAAPVLVAGSPLPAAVTKAVPSLASSPVTYVVWLTSQCASCRDLAAQLRERWTAAPVGDVLVLLSGTGAAVDSLTADLEPYAEVVRSPQADAVSEALALDTSPFVIEVEQGVITGWVTPGSADDIDNLREARSTSEGIVGLPLRCGPTGQDAGRGSDRHQPGEVT